MTLDIQQTMESETRVEVLPQTSVPIQTSSPKIFQNRNTGFKKPEKIIKSKPRIVKDNQTWISKDNKKIIKIIGQTKYFRCTAFFNVVDIDERGNNINDFVDEFTEEEIIENYRLQRSYGKR